MRGHRARTGGRLRLGDRGEPSQRWRLSDSPLTLRSHFSAWGVFQPQNSARCPEVTRNLDSGPEMTLEAAVFPGQSGERESESRRQRQPRQSSELPSVRTHRMHRVSQVAILSANPGSPHRDAGCVSSPPNSLLLPPASATCCPFSGKHRGPAVGWTQCLPHQPVLPRAPRRGTCPPQSPESQCQRSKAHSRLHGPPPPLASHPV